MQSRIVSRVGGYASILAAVLLVLGMALTFLQGTFQAPSVAATWLGFGSYALMQLALFSMYSSHAGQVGILGLVGFLLAFVGVSGFIGFTVAGEQTALPIQVIGPLTAIGFVVGFLLTGIASWRSATFPKAAILSLVVGVIAFVTGIRMENMLTLIGALLLGVGLAWIGARLVAE